MAVEVEEVLALWREAERLLEGLPGEAPERVLVQERVDALKVTYRRLTTEPIVDPNLLFASALDHIEETRQLLDGLRRRFERSPV